MDKAVILPIEKCDIRVQVGRDGVWLHFGNNAMIHVGNVLAPHRGGIVESNIHQWILAREEQAKNAE